MCNYEAAERNAARICPYEMMLMIARLQWSRRGSTVILHSYIYHAPDEEEVGQQVLQDVVLIIGRVAIKLKRSLKGR